MGWGPDDSRRRKWLGLTGLSVFSFVGVVILEKVSRKLHVTIDCPGFLGERDILAALGPLSHVAAAGQSWGV